MRKTAILILSTIAALRAAAQPDTLTLSLEETIEMAQANSPSARRAKHSFLAAEWQYKYYRANYLPSLSLSSSPYLNRQVNKITMGDGTSSFIKQNQLGTDMALSINQNVALTGGSVFVKASMNRLDELERKTTHFSSQPLLVGYQQSLFGHNSLKWDRRIEPLRYREARKDYAEAMALVAAQASSNFFALAMAKSNLDMARLNFASADTLYIMAKGRHSIGSINENELLQLEINRLNEETACMDAEVALKERTQSLRSFLGIEGDVEFRLVMPDTVPAVQIDLAEALAKAMENGADRDYYERLRLEGRSSLSRARANARLRADLYVQFGLSQTGETMRESFTRPQNQQYASVTLSLPILDWGRSRGQVRVAESNLELTNLQADQGMLDFEQNVRRLVMQFNMQSRRIAVAARTTQQADHRYDIARRLYVLGRSTILDLNDATAAKDSARRSYIAAMQTWWQLFYTIQSLTGDLIDG